MDYSDGRVGIEFFFPAFKGKGKVAPHSYEIFVARHVTD